MKPNLALFAAALALTAGPALAQSTFYSDRTAFLANASETTTLDFEGIAPAVGNGFYSVPPGLTLSGVNFGVDTAHFPNQILVVTSNGPNDFYPGNSVLSTECSQPGATGNLRITFSHPVTAIGLDLGDNFHTATTATFRLSDGETFTRVPGNGSHFFGTSPGPDFNFVGLTARTPITYMDIQEPDNYALNIDNFTFGTAAPVPPATGPISGFTDPGGFTLNGNSGGYDGQDATAHGVPALSGGTLHLTTTKGVPDAQYNTFFGAENSTIFANQKHDISRFYASFVYHYNGTNPLSFGPGNGCAFILQNDPRGLHALGGSGLGNGQIGDFDTIVSSASVEFGLFTGFGQPRGTQLAFNGDPGVTGIYRVPGRIDLVGGNPISVVLSYDGATLSETLTDTVTRAVYSTSYAADLPAAVGGTSAYVGFCGGTGAAVADQTITNFLFSSAAPAVAPPPAAAPQLSYSVRAVKSGTDSLGVRTFHILINVTNTGTVYADRLQFNSVTLNGAAPIPPPAGDPHNTLPTIPNLLSPGVTQTEEVVYFVSPGSTRGTVGFGGTYINPITNGQQQFSASLRVALP